MSSSASPNPRPLAAFFGKFHHFNYDPQKHASEEIGRLRRLCRLGLHGTGYGDKEDDELMDAYRDALTLEFNALYGTDANDLGAWQTLCGRIGLDPIPTSLEECHERVTNTHVNLIDLMHVHGTSETVERFESVYDLSDYTISNRKYFPRDNVLAGNLLIFLLRHIIDPARNEQNRRDGRGRKGGKERRSGKGGAK